MTTTRDSHNDAPAAAAQYARPAPAPSRGIFSVPAPVKRVFDRFPLVTYEANDLPQRAPRNRKRHQLYVWSTPAEAKAGVPSFNPSCLKWQAYLKFSNIEVTTVASNNHASPSGALPFLLPASSNILNPPAPVPAGKLQRWAKDHSTSAIEEPSDLRYEAYLSLLDLKIRRAWLYNLYLTSNFHTIIQPLYLTPTSTSPLVRLALAHELRAAATAELLKHTPTIDVGLLYTEADDALAALETALGDAEWFFGAPRPTLFDASVFAYTHLLLDDELGEGWTERTVCRAVRKRQRLVAHRNRILNGFFARDLDR